MQLDVIYVTIYSTSIYRVFFKRSALEEYLYWYKVLSSFIAGVFLNKG